MIKHINTPEDFEAAVQQAEIVLVDFYSTECPPCEKLAPMIERLSSAHPEIMIVKIWRQELRQLAQSLGVTGSPTVLFYCHGKLQDKRLAGEIDENELIGTFYSLLKKEKLTYKKIESKSSQESCDLCIIGAGPAGMTAAIYAARYKINQILIGDLPGGLITSAHKICNYPSETEITGMDLAQKMEDHVKNLKVDHRHTTVKNITRKNSGFTIETADNYIISAKTILLATGTKHRHLELKNERELTGRGISYCATCDGMFYANKTVAVIGGSDAANTSALYLADVAKKVYQIYRGKELRGETAWVDLIKNNPKIEVLLETNIIKLNGEQRLQSLELDKPYNGTSTLKVDGLFVEIGSYPDSGLIKQLQLKTDESGYIQTDATQKTSVQNVWAAGDITTGSNGFRQIVTAEAEGAIAAENIFKHLSKNKN